MYELVIITLAALCFVIGYIAKNNDGKIKCVRCGSKILLNKTRTGKLVCPHCNFSYGKEER